MARRIGTPIYLDATTNKSLFDQEFGHYSRIFYKSP